MSLLRTRTFEYGSGTGRNVLFKVDAANRIVELDLHGEINVCDLEKYVVDLRKNQLRLNDILDAE